MDENKENSKKFGNAFIRKRKLVLNYARSSGTHPLHKIRPHCTYISYSYVLFLLLFGVIALGEP
jgi:hypothetical protein